MGYSNIEKLLRQKAELDARIQQTKNRNMTAERKRETRRRILAGEYAMKMFDGDLKKLGIELLNAGILEPRDFALFGVTENVNYADTDSMAAV
ncbi:hypothetical protein AAKU67_004447 [Oxalobacteraceae bacterium GrIS 2.11]